MNPPLLGDMATGVPIKDFGAIPDVLLWQREPVRSFSLAPYLKACIAFLYDVDQAWGRLKTDSNTVRIQTTPCLSYRFPGIPRLLGWDIEVLSYPYLQNIEIIYVNPANLLVVSNESECIVFRAKMTAGDGGGEDKNDV